MRNLATGRIDELVAFRATAEAGSLSAAAKLLHIPVNQVSRRLARLEERFGVVLIARTTRRSSLTQEGERFLVRTRRVLSELEAAELELRDDGGPRGTLRIAVPTLFVTAPVLTRIASTLRSHTALSIELLVRDSPIDPIALGCDAAVVVDRPEAGSCRLSPLGTIAPVLAATRDYLEQAGTPTKPKDLIGHECLRFNETHAQTHWALVGPRGRRCRVRVGGRFASDDSRVLRDAMHAGLGIGLAPEWVLRAGESRLVRVLPRYHFGPCDLYALSPPGPRSPRHAMALSLLRRAVETWV